MIDAKDRPADDKARKKAEVAAIVEGLQSLLSADEQLLGFTRGRLAGGLKGKLTIGLDAFFAPFVNVGLTERRVILQHIHPENGKPSEILPHSFPLADVTNVSFSDIETFGSEAAGRLVVSLPNEQSFRVRFGSDALTDNARSFVEVYRSLMTARHRSSVSATQTACGICGHILDEPVKFCPYCGSRIGEPPPEQTASAPTNGEDSVEQVAVRLDVSDLSGPPASEPEPAVAESLAEDIHRFTEEGGAQAAVDLDDQITPDEERPQPPPDETFAVDPHVDEVWPPRPQERK